MALRDEQLEPALGSLPASLAESVRLAVNGSHFCGRFVPADGIPAEAAASLLPLANAFSVHPVSGFSVGAVAVGQSGALYLGANLEYQGMALHATLHAEQSAVLNAWMHEESELEAIYVSETPCGHCRQFLRELSNIDTLQIHVGDHVHTIDDLLPHAFGERRAKGHGLLDSRPASLESVRPEPDTSQQRAINAARRSYTPYSRSSEGFVIECLDGHFYAGRAAESIAFNPSVTGVLSALNQRNLSGSREIIITKATQAKLATAINNPLPFARLLINSISNAGIQVVQMDGQ